MTAGTGAAAEDAAAAFLARRGLTLVERNWRCRSGEIDLVMRDGATLVFVEVRLRSNSRFGGAAASITDRKRARVVAAAHQYLARLGTVPPCRFDAVLMAGCRVGDIDWLRGAFDAG